MISEGGVLPDKIREAYNIKTADRQYRIILAGNPNVGKSTVFNELTGLKQHTGNWAGKTVSSAAGTHKYGGEVYRLMDTPGIYSLAGEIAEEKAARDQICLSRHDGIIVVCDATHMERNLALALECMAVTDRVLLCVNLIDEAEKNNIIVDTDMLEEILGINVCAISARNRQGLDALMYNTRLTIGGEGKNRVYKTKYPEEIETAMGIIEGEVKKGLSANVINPRFVCMKLLCGDYDFIRDMDRELKIKIGGDRFKQALQNARDYLAYSGLNEDDVRAEAAKAITKAASYIAGKCIKISGNTSNGKYDKILTGKYSGGLLMAGLLFVVLWITIYGVILLAFILGFPANEIVIPIMIMIYTATGSLGEISGAGDLKLLFEANGWTWVTACSTMLFTLFHWPCSTTMLTIKKETASNKWTFISLIVPMMCGIVICILFNFVIWFMGVQ